MIINRWSSTNFQAQRQSKQHCFLKAEVDSHELIHITINKTKPEVSEGKFPSWNTFAFSLGVDISENWNSDARGHQRMNLQLHGADRCVVQSGRDYFILFKTMVSEIKLPGHKNLSVWCIIYKIAKKLINTVCSCLSNCRIGILIVTTL